MREVVVRRVRPPIPKHEVGPAQRTRTGSLRQKKVLAKPVATLSDVQDALIDEPCVILVDGAPAVLYMDLEGYDEHALGMQLHALRHTSYVMDWRTSGMQTNSRIFGYYPRNPLRHDYCKVASLANEKPLYHSGLAGCAKLADHAFAKHLPAQHEQQLRRLDQLVLPDWRLWDTAFTSGIANKNSPLHYHNDQGNLSDSWSCMIVRRSNSMLGGQLVLPELGAALSCRDKTAVLFQGARWQHGVTPLKPVNRAAYRYSVVYYAMEQLQHCLTADQEVSRIRGLRTEREGRSRKELPQ